MTEYRLLADAVREHARIHADHPALIFGDRSTSYSQLWLNARRVANGLLALGLSPRSRIAILTGNNDVFFDIWLGASLGGFVLAPINARLAGPEVSYIVSDSEAEIVFVDAPLHAMVEAIADKLTAVRHIVSLDTHPVWPNFIDWRDSQSSTEPDLALAPDDTVVQMYTSGTTGFPKGVELSHRAVLACVRVMMGRTAWAPGEIALVTAPLFHTAGAGWAQCALQSGATSVLLRESTPASILRAIEAQRITQALLVPAVIQRVLQSPECASTDFSTLKRMLYGASPIPVPRLRQALAVFRCELEQGYGLTESVGPVAMLRPEDHDGAVKLESCGKAVPGTRIRVVDASGADCPTGTVGEIIIASPQVMKGYWKRPKETAASIRDGWLYTGDAGYFDGDGYLFIYDRLKDMIVSGGENVYPVEVENVLAEYPDVADVAVIGVPDERWGEAVKAIVVPRPGAALSERALIAFAHERIAGFKCPKSVDVVDAIARNPSGKILKRKLREPYWAGHERRVS